MSEVATRAYRHLANGTESENRQTDGRTDGRIAASLYPATKGRCDGKACLRACSRADPRRVRARTQCERLFSGTDRGADTGLRGRSVRRSRKTRRMPKLLRCPCGVVSDMNTSNSDTATSVPSITFQPLRRYACCPVIMPFAITCPQRNRLTCSGGIPAITISSHLSVRQFVRRTVFRSQLKTSLLTHAGTGRSVG